MYNAYSDQYQILFLRMPLNDYAAIPDQIILLVNKVQLQLVVNITITNMH